MPSDRTLSLKKLAGVPPPHLDLETKMEAASAGAASVKCVLTGTVHGATT